MDCYLRPCMKEKGQTDPDGMYATSGQIPLPGPGLLGLSSLPVPWTRIARREEEIMVLGPKNATDQNTGMLVGKWAWMGYLQSRPQTCMSWSGGGVQKGFRRVLTT